MMSMRHDVTHLTRRTGHYIFDHEASAEEKKRILGDTVQEKAKLCQALHSSSFVTDGLQVTTAFTKGARRVEADFSFGDVFS